MCTPRTSLVVDLNPRPRFRHSAPNGAPAMPVLDPTTCPLLGVRASHPDHVDGLLAAYRMWLDDQQAPLGGHHCPPSSLMGMPYASARSRISGQYGQPTNAWWGLQAVPRFRDCGVWRWSTARSRATWRSTKAGFSAAMCAAF